MAADPGKAGDTGGIGAFAGGGGLDTTGFDTAGDAAAAGGAGRPELNADQQRAVVALREALGTFRPFVLEGVTGSGKTEVYLRVNRDGRRAGAPGAGAHSGDRPHPAIARPLPCAAVLPRGGAALPTLRPRTALGVDACAQRHRGRAGGDALRGVRPAGASGALHRRRRARSLVQAAGRVPVLRARSRGGACPGHGNAGGARQRDPLARSNRQRTARALPPSHAAASRRRGPRRRASTWSICGPGRSTAACATCSSKRSSRRRPDRSRRSCSSTGVGTRPG